MSGLDEVGERDGWRCWLCDKPVDGQLSVNDARGPSVDSLQSDAKSRKAARAKAARGKAAQGNAAQGDEYDGGERLAHRACNTGKGAVKAEVPWPEDLFVSDPAPLIAVADRLGRKGGREVVARCPTRDDADQAADWLVDRFSRLAPQLWVETDVVVGGGQFLVALIGGR